MNAGIIEAKLRTPNPPDHVVVEVPGATGKAASTVRICDLNTDQRDWLAVEWRKKLDAVAARQESNPATVYRDGPGDKWNKNSNPWQRR